MLLLSDNQIEQDWRDTHPNDPGLRGTTVKVYTDAQVRRKHRQEYVMRHWDQTDCQILFLTILGYTAKNMEQEIGISRQAIQKRMRRMCQQVGVKEEIQLVLWILGFLTLHADGTTSTTGASLMRPQDFHTPFGRRILATLRLGPSSSPQKNNGSSSRASASCNSPLNSGSSSIHNPHCVRRIRPRAKLHPERPTLFKPPKTLRYRVGCAARNVRSPQLLA